MGNKFNFADVRKKAVAKAEKELEQGLEQMAEQGGETKEVMTVAAVSPAVPASGEAEATAAEPTKGVQTYIPMSQYRRLLDIKLTSGQNIADLAAQAIYLWLDVQEGKKTIGTVEG
jgi:hypothetical protein